MDGAVSIKKARTFDKLSTTLETVGSGIWKDIFALTKACGTM